MLNFMSQIINQTISLVALVFSLIVTLVIIIGYYNVFRKAGELGIAAIIPVYNIYIIFKIAFGCGWLALLIFVPCVNMIALIAANYNIARRFGKDMVFACLTAIFPGIFIPILGFGNSTYY